MIKFALKRDIWVHFYMCSSDSHLLACLQVYIAHKYIKSLKFIKLSYVLATFYLKFKLSHEHGRIFSRIKMTMVTPIFFNI